MITLQIKTKIPPNRHIDIGLDLPDSIEPGDAEIMLMVKNANDSNKYQKLKNEKIQEKLLRFSTWSEEDIQHLKIVREEMKKWQPEEF